MLLQYAQYIAQPVNIQPEVPLHVFSCLVAATAQQELLLLAQYPANPAHTLLEGHLLVRLAQQASIKAIMEHLIALGAHQEHTALQTLLAAQILMLGVIRAQQDYQFHVPINALRAHMLLGEQRRAL